MLEISGGNHKNTVPQPHDFGGRWTEIKLEILEKYLDAYTNVFRNQTTLKIMYIDAFAGTGKITLPYDFISGSTKRAIDIDNRPFDKLLFIEKDADRCRELDSLRVAHPNREIQVINSDANQILQRAHPVRSNWRGVLFLDPYGAQVEWATIEKIAELKMLDTWILFPTATLLRKLPKLKMPDEVFTEWRRPITKVFGDNSWETLYQEPKQPNLFGEPERDSGAGGLVSAYKEKLNCLFGERFLELSKTLKNSNGVPLYEFIFCVGSPSAKAILRAKEIATRLLKKI